MSAAQRCWQVSPFLSNREQSEIKQDFPDTVQMNGMALRPHYPSGSGRFIGGQNADGAQIDVSMSPRPVLGIHLMFQIFQYGHKL